MADLSVLIPARCEEFLKRTVEDVLAHAKGSTEIIVVLDGEWADPPLDEHPQVQVIYLPEAIGQRAATNLAARISTAKYVMKLDAHCSVDDGFDVKLIEAGETLGHDVTQIPRQYNLHIYNWKCLGCGTETYHGPDPTACKACSAKGTPGGPFERVIYWDRNAGGVNGKHVRSDYWCVDHTLHFAYFHEFGKRPEAKGQIVDVMSSLGACFFMRRERFHELGGLDEAVGSWGQFGQEIAFKSWLSGGRQVVNKNTWFAHFFRVGGIGFPYDIKGSDQDKARVYSRDLWLRNGWSGQVRPVSWLLDKFWPVNGWSQVAFDKASAAGSEFALSKKSGLALRTERVEIPTGAVMPIGDGLVGSEFAHHVDALQAPSQPVLVPCGQHMTSLAVGFPGVVAPLAPEHVLMLSDQFQVVGVAATRGVADEVVKDQIVGEWSDEPRIHKPVKQERLIVGPGKVDSSVAFGVLVPTPQPTSVVGDVDGGKQNSNEFGRNSADRERLAGNHSSVSIADGWPGSASRGQRDVDSPIIPSKSVIYYSDNRPDRRILDSCKVQLVTAAAGLPIVSVTLKPTDLGLNIVLPLERGYLTMARQILIALEMSSSDVVFFAEHDLLYHASSFQFTPERTDTVYYNQNCWRVDYCCGNALFYFCNQLSGLCAYRSVLLDHFRARVAKIEKDGFTRSMGFEPGTRKIRHGGIDDRPFATWMSDVPNIDIRHKHTLTPSRWKKEQFRNQRYTAGWTESDSVPGWGRTKGRFKEMLSELAGTAVTV